ncbi:glycosyltransferase family 4 protein [Roseomonas sp. 18066]|uniref:glycosyltransferase family 4 protein n=1 Tax=Roseomonas sp. 18066 TaxID=2681412 RepID=UPI00135CA3A7|nr:glycosyltransferase family 4 protein [Roseomonas sp. 18066]
MAPPPNAAIGFAADGFQTDRTRLMGRHVAGDGFLRGLIRHGGVDRLAAYLLAAGDAPVFEQLARKAGATMALEAIAPHRLDRLAALGTLMLPGPEVAHYARARRFAGSTAYSVVGVTHTTASHGAMEAIAGLLAGPAEPWDALICTSRAVAATARSLLEAEAAQLRERLGAQRFPLPLLPVIPLGIDCAAFAPPEGARAAWRARLGIAEDTVVVLSLSRLSWHAKAHPVALFGALGRAARRPGAPKLHCVLAGWFAHGEQEPAHRGMAQALAPEVGLSILDARTGDSRQGLHAMADVFALLVDNIQETYGLAPVEAMAAGLPVVVSDWDGFKDTVRHGEDGFRIPSLMAPPGSAGDLALRHATGALNYDHYLGASTQLVALDIAAGAEAFFQLATQPELRRKMGAAGQARALQHFDWKVVIGQYQALWSALAERRQAATPGPRALDPRFADPTEAFAAYPSAALAGAMRVEADPAAVASIDGLAAVPGGLHRAGGGLGVAALAALLHRLRQEGPLTVAALLPEEGRAAALRGLLWLMKSGFVRRVPGA